MHMDFVMGVIDVAGEDNPSEAPGLNLGFNRSFCVVLAFDLFVLFYLHVCIFKIFVSGFPLHDQSTIIVD